MPVLTNSKRFDYLNISPEEIAAGRTRFSKIIEENYSKYQNLARNRMKAFPTAAGVGRGEITALSILFGMCEVLSVEGGPELGFYFDFFRYYFSIAWDASDAREQKVLTGWLESGLKDPRQFTALFFELQVAFTYLRYGNNVNLVGWTDGDDPGFDIEVTAGGKLYCVEVKTIDMSAGLPFDKHFMDSAMNKLVDSLRERVRIPWEVPVEIEIHYRGERQPSREYLQVELEAVAEILSLDNRFVRRDGMNVRIRPIRKGYIEEFALRQSTDINYRPDVMHNMGFIAEGISALVCVTTIHETKFSERVCKLIKDVCTRQVPSDANSVLWVHFVGHFSDNAQETLKNFLILNPAIPEQVNYRQERGPGVPGLIGVHFCADSQTGNAGPGGAWQISIPMCSACAEDYAPDFDKYLVDALGPRRPDAKYEVFPVSRKRSNSAAKPEAK